MYTTGLFVVKKGHEDEFVRLWETSASSLVLELPDVTFRLLRDRESPRRFLSLGEGWRNVEQIEEVRDLQSFQDATAAIARLLDAADDTTMDLVVEVS